jgi:hypothetical protein
MARMECEVGGAQIAASRQVVNGDRDLPAGGG